jgi:hypothetical protein
VVKVRKRAFLAAKSYAGLMLLQVESRFVTVSCGAMIPFAARRGAHLGLSLSDKLPTDLPLAPRIRNHAARVA